MSHELLQHLKAQGEGHEDVINVQGAMRKPDGTLMIAIEMAPGGTVYAMIPRIDKAVKDGVISERAGELMRLTLLRDMMKGVQHFQETSKMTHLDIKGPNFLIG